MSSDVAAEPSAIVEDPALDDLPVEPTESRAALVRTELRARITSLRSLAVVLVFAAGLVGGVIAFGALNPASPPAAWPALPGLPEPAAAHRVAAAIAADDASGLADVLDPNVLAALGNMLDPVIEVSDVRFLGAAGNAGDAFAAYLVRGHDSQGSDAIVGFVLHVRSGQVVGVNA